VRLGSRKEKQVVAVVTEAANPYLPPHLQEVCAILALGILRLRSRTAVECASTFTEGRERGDIRLHSTAWQRLHANTKRKGVA
jgi:hypothetical protein